MKYSLESPATLLINLTSLEKSASDLTFPCEYANMHIRKSMPSYLSSFYILLSLSTPWTKTPSD